jgi:hypothetical protein
MRESYTIPAREPSQAVKTAPNMLINVCVFVIFTILWVAFVAALLFCPGALDGVGGAARIALASADTRLATVTPRGDWPLDLGDELVALAAAAACGWPGGREHRRLLPVAAED